MELSDEVTKVSKIPIVDPKLNSTTKISEYPIVNPELNSITKPKETTYLPIINF